MLGCNLVMTLYQKINVQPQCDKIEWTKYNIIEFEIWN